MADEQVATTDAQNNTNATDGAKKTPDANADGQSKSGQEGNSDGGEQKTTVLSGDTTKVDMKAPENYESFTLPEGVSLGDEMMGKFGTLGKELNLNQESAQKLVDLAVSHTQGLVKEQTDGWSKIREGWVNEIKSDKDFGGNNFSETVERAKRSLGKYGSPELIKSLESTGYGDNPELIKLLSRIDKVVGEDKTIDGTAIKGEKSAADTIYGNTN